MILMRRIIVLWFAFSFSVTLSVQEIDSLKLRRSIEFSYANDFFFNVDYYFTQGIHLEVFLPALRKNPISNILVKLPQGVDNAFGVSANEECYTPSSIRHNYIPFGDRPYAGSLFVSLSRYSLNHEKQLRLTTHLDLGIMGPNGYGHEIQSGIHHATGSQQPEGWQFQLANSPIVNYSVLLEKGILNSRLCDVQAFSQVRFGSYFDDVRVGINARLGWLKNYFENDNSSSPFRFWIFGSGEMETVGYNATLQGGFFTNNSYVVPTKDMTRIVFCGTVGITSSYKKLRLGYSSFYLSPEYKNGWAHKWGQVKLSVIF